MRLPEPPCRAPVLVGYSGGLDSTVLLHLLAEDPGIRAAGLAAIHVHHGLQADADAWAAHSLRECDALGIALQVVRVEVDRGAGLGPEGAARVARHRAFAAALPAGALLALAHHRDDQAETFLLRALRGAGSDGLGSMRPWRAYAGGWLWRPLLGIDREALRGYAASHGLRWVEDPSNAGEDLDRVFLRNAVMPLLRRRWPHAAGSFARSAALAAESAALLEDADASALAEATRDPHTLDVDALQALPAARRARVLRLWVAGLGLPPLPGRGIARIEAELLPARADARARLDWVGARMQRWRQLLHAGRIRDPLPPAWSHDWDGTAALPLPGGDRLELVGARGFDAPLRAHARRGGERIVLPGRTHSHALKQALQAAAVPPWRRAGMPLLSAADGQLLAAGDAILSARMAAWLQTRDACLRWTRVA